MIEVVPAHWCHIDHLAATMREEQREECALAGFPDPRAAVRASLRESFEAWTCLKDGRPIAMWGAAAPNLLGHRVDLWLLTGDVTGHKRKLLEWPAAFVSDMSGRYPLVTAAVAERYTAANRWLRWLGFEPEMELVPGLVMMVRRQTDGSGGGSRRRSERGGGDQAGASAAGVG